MSEATKSTASATMEAFFTRQKSNEGVVFDLDLPDGTPSGHWLRVRGRDSDAFKATNAKMQREILDWGGDMMKNGGKEPSADEMTKRYTEGRMELMSSLIVSWSFPEECSKENVVKFLTEAPYIADQIDQLVTRRRLFFGLSSTNSSPSPEPSSS